MNEELTRKLNKINKDYKRGFISWGHYEKLINDLKTIYNIEGEIE